MYSALLKMLSGWLLVFLLFGCEDNSSDEDESIAEGLTYQGFVYKTVKIGNQVWTVENLRVSQYNDGKPIRLETNAETWSKLNEAAYCMYDNDEKNVALNGYLYNWYAIESGKLAPKTGGWRVPTNEDWTKLESAVGGSSIAGTKLKSTTGWNDSGNGTDDFGFKAYPGGYRSSAYGVYSSIGNYGYWWSSTPDVGASAWGRYIYNTYPDVYKYGFVKRAGFSIRLVRDL